MTTETTPLADWIDSYVHRADGDTHEALRLMAADLGIHDQDVRYVNDQDDETRGEQHVAVVTPISQNPAPVREHTCSTHKYEKPRSDVTSLDSESGEHEVCS